MREPVETIIVGGGQAGLALSYFLKQAGRENLVLEQADRPVPAWRNERWDSFTLVTPNWAFQIPGMEYRGDDPGGFMLREQVVAAFDRYIAENAFPLRTNVRVTAVDSQPQGYQVSTSVGEFDARNVVIATGLFQQARIPGWTASIPAEITQLSPGKYRNPDALPEGAVLVVGAGQTGCQIAEELYQAGRTVYISTGVSLRAPRRYRGRDITEWLREIGFFDRTPAILRSPRERFMGAPQVSGKGGGRSLNLHVFARDGVRLLGHLRAGEGFQVSIAPDLHENLAKTDGFEKELLARIDQVILASGAAAPVEEVPIYRDGYQQSQIEHLDLKKAGIQTMIWGSGFRFDYSMVHLPVVDEFGFPLQERGVTRFPGLYFLGMPWLYKFKSGLLYGVGEDAEYIARRICS